jgi:hypothetical protein
MVTIQIVCNKPFVESNQRWIRLPKKGVCPWCGLSRSHLSELISNNKIRSVTLKKPGNVRGPRLIWLPSVFEYIEQKGQVEGPERDQSPEKAPETYSITLDGIEGMQNALYSGDGSK